MRYCLLTGSFDPSFNLAAEEYLFEKADRSCEYMMIWRNEPTVVVGKYQNTVEEIDSEYVTNNDIKVVRRLSGGGAVFQDLGNINYSVLMDCSDSSYVDFAPYMEMIVGFLNSVGINADINGRNDLTIGNKKISGNSQYVKDGRVLHHGTLLFNLNLYMAAKALEPPDCKIESKGIKSVKSRIMNIESLLKNNTTIEQFQQEMIKYFSEVYGYRVKEFTEKEKEYIDAIKKNRYDRWEWNYGYSPEYKKCRRYSIPGCGNFKVQMNIKDGIVTNISLSGDFFGNQSLQGLYSILEGCRLSKNDISVKLAEVDINNYIYNISKKDFIEMIVY